jgi:hypothetical protein
MGFVVKNTSSSTPQVCISLDLSGGWNDKLCQTKTGANNVANCVCTTLSATTVVNDLDNLFANSNFGKAFSAAGLSAFLSFPFYKSYIFYIFVVKTLLVIAFIYYGYKKDLKKF